MLDIAVAYNRYKFLGYEFLTWLWYITATRNQPVAPPLDLVSLSIGNRIVLENHTTVAMETVTIKGDEADLKEGLLALRKGALVSEISLILTTDQLEYHFVLKGESLSLASVKLPSIGPAEGDSDSDALILERIYLIEHLTGLLDAFYHAFIIQRLTPEWDREFAPQISRWTSETQSQPV